MADVVFAEDIEQAPTVSGEVSETANPDTDLRGERDSERCQFADWMAELRSYYGRTVDCVEIMQEMAVSALYEATLKSGCGMGFFKLAKDGINKRFDNFRAVRVTMEKLRLPRYLHYSTPGEIFLFSERHKLADSFRRWAEQNGIAQTEESLIAYLFAEDLLDVPKCRLLISEMEET